MLTRSLAALSLVAALSGCGANLVSVRPTTGIPGVVRVDVKRIKGAIVILDVVNESNDVLLVQRDAIVLRDSHGPRARMTGGIMANYTIPPAGHHAVNLRYDLAKLDKANPVYLELAGAIVIGNTPLTVAPIELHAN